MMIATGFALANETKFDKSVEAAAARIAASKLGEIRSTIDHDEVAFIVTRKVLRKQEAQLNLLPRPATHRATSVQNDQEFHFLIFDLFQPWQLFRQDCGFKAH